MPLSPSAFSTFAPLLTGDLFNQDEVAQQGTKGASSQQLPSLQGASPRADSLKQDAGPRLLRSALGLLVESECRFSYQLKKIPCDPILTHLMQTPSMGSVIRTCLRMS